MYEWYTVYFNIICLTLYPPNYSIWIFTHLKLCLADAIHNFKWVKIIQIWQNGGQLFSNLAGWCHILSLTYLKCGTWCSYKKWKPEYMRHRRVKGWGSILHFGYVPQYTRDRIMLRNQVSRSNKIVLRSQFYWRIPANMRRPHEVGSMLVQRRRRWTSIEPALGEYLVFAGIWQTDPVTSIRPMSCVCLDT